MRQWHLPTQFLCRQHLLGEHVEHHMFVGTINKGISVDGYIRDRLLIPTTLVHRHELLVREMRLRGMNHRSPLPTVDIDKLRSMKCPPIDGLAYLRDNLLDITNRCEHCRHLQTKTYEGDLRTTLLNWFETHLEPLIL